MPPGPLLLDGKLYSQFLPPDFNRRTQYRYVRHSKPDKDGVTRWKCPFCAGLLRSRQFPETMRPSRKAPLVQLPDWVTQCCNGTLSAPQAELPLTQQIPFGTSAWRISMYRRQAVESVNAALQGSFTNLAHPAILCDVDAEPLVEGRHGEAEIVVDAQFIEKIDCAERVAQDYLAY